MSRNPTIAIIENLRLEPVAGLPDIRLYTAHSGSRLSHFASDDLADPPAPYWAYAWAGGLALALYLSDDPDMVAGKRVLDLGAGSGLVGIVAAKAGAHVTATEIDPNGRAAIALNAVANGVEIDQRCIDLAGPPPEEIDLIVAGDVFYNAEVAARMLPFLRSCRAGGIEVLIGDPVRRDLPVAELERLVSYAVGDVGDARDTAERIGSVYRLRG